MWITRFGEEVGLGDYVALSLLEHPDAEGWIVARAQDGQARCVLAACRGRHLPVTHVVVNEDQILLRMKEDS